MFLRVCMIKDHEQKSIEFACVYPECNLSRFLCTKCLRVGTHKHQQSDQTHILDPKELFECLKDKIIKQKNSKNKNKKQHIDYLKQTLFEIETILKQLVNIIKAMEQSIPSIRDKQLDNILQRLQNDGFNQLDDNDLKNLIKIDQKFGDIYKQLSEQSNSIIQNLIRIQDYCQLEMKDDSELEQKIKDAKYQLITQDQVEGNFDIYSSAISNDLKYVASGGTDEIVKIWNYENNTLIKSIQFDNYIYSIKFTEDSKILYVGKKQYLYQLDINNQFKETYKQAIHSDYILNILCITNTIILTSSCDKTIIKTDINIKQQLLVIKAHFDRINGLDYNVNLNMIASGSVDKSIKLWNGNNGELIIDKQNAHNDGQNICQVLFINKKNQLISLDATDNILIWNLNFEEKQLVQIQKITDTNDIFNISLVLDQQYITLICKEYIKIYSIKGNYIRSISHDVKEFCNYQLNQIISYLKNNTAIIYESSYCKRKTQKLYNHFRNSTDFQNKFRLS